MRPTIKKWMEMVILCDLFGMVKWPFEMVKWPPTRGFKGHFESPGVWWFPTISYVKIGWKSSNWFPTIYFNGWLQGVPGINLLERKGKTHTPVLFIILWNFVKVSHFPKDHLTLQWKGEWTCIARVGSSKWRQFWGVRILRVKEKNLVYPSLPKSPKVHTFASFLSPFLDFTFQTTTHTMWSLN